MLVCKASDTESQPQPGSDERWPGRAGLVSVRGGGEGAKKCRAARTAGGSGSAVFMVSWAGASSTLQERASEARGARASGSCVPLPRALSSSRCLNESLEMGVSGCLSRRVALWPHDDKEPGP